MDLFVLCVACLTVVVNCLVVVDILVLLSVGGGALFDRPCMVFQRMCVWCAWDPSVRLDVPSICFACVLICRKLYPHLRVFELDHRCLLSLCCFFV